MSLNSKEAILAAARLAAQAHGYNGLNFRSLAQDVGIKASSIHYFFPTKADLGAAVAKRYWEDTKAGLEAMADEAPDAVEALRQYPSIFRMSLESNNRMCLCSFMAAEYDDLPDSVKAEVQTFADINITWLERALTVSGTAGAHNKQRAQAIFAAVAGAQLMARSRSDISLFDVLVDSYRTAGLLPA